MEGIKRKMCNIQNPLIPTEKKKEANIEEDKEESLKGCSLRFRISVSLLMTSRYDMGRIHFFML